MTFVLKAINSAIAEVYNVESKLHEPIKITVSFGWSGLEVKLSRHFQRKGNWVDITIEKTHQIGFDLLDVDDLAPQIVKQRLTAMLADMHQIVLPIEHPEIISLSKKRV